MTREEAKRQMEICRDFLANNYSDMGEPNFTAFNMAIQALSQEPCDDAISREMALKECHDIVIDGERYRVIQEETLLGLPPVTVRQTNCEYDKSGYCYSDDSCNYQFCGIHEEQKLGKWITEEIGGGRKVYCSECKESAVFEYVRDEDIYSSYGHGVVKKTKYCPNCGAEMESSE